jgi:quercetin dioxygenase-like cupin family protein
MIGVLTSPAEQTLNSQRPNGVALAICALWLWLAPETSAAQQPYSVKPIAETKIRQLPAGELYWRVETFGTLAEAQAAAGKDGLKLDSVGNPTTASLIAEVSGRAWLFTLGPPGAATPGANKVAEIGPVPPITAPEYLLRVNQGSGPPGSKTATHTHPGSEAFYVLTGRLAQRTKHGVKYVDAGHTMNGHPADTPMEVSNGGSSDVTALIMFVVDASKPFSSPATFD